MRCDALTSPAESTSCSAGGSQVSPRWVQSPLLGSGATQMGLQLLDAAAEQFIVHRDFQTSFGLCEKGLALLEDNEHEHGR